MKLLHKSALKKHATPFAVYNHFAESAITKHTLQVYDSSTYFKTFLTASKSTRCWLIYECISLSAQGDKGGDTPDRIKESIIFGDILYQISRGCT